LLQSKEEENSEAKKKAGSKRTLHMQGEEKGWKKNGWRAFRPLGVACFLTVDFGLVFHRC
jgi:hypothetical protein